MDAIWQKEEKYRCLKGQPLKYSREGVLKMSR